MPNQIPSWREKWGNLSEFMKEIKQGFSHFYNKQHKRRGFFWCDRFKSVLVEDGETLINCLAYVDLNPVRGGIVARPDDYRWNTLGYHQQADNMGNFLSLDFGLIGGEKLSAKQRLRSYRQFVYEVGSIETIKGKCIAQEIVAVEAQNSFVPTVSDRFLSRTRCFTDSGIIGSKKFISRLWDQCKTDTDSNEKPPTRITGLEGVYSLKRLRENIMS